MKEIFQTGNVEKLEEIRCFDKRFEFSYFQLLIKWKICESISNWFVKKNLKEDYDNVVKYYESFYLKFEEFKYLNTDFYVYDLIGICFNPSLVKI